MNKRLRRNIMLFHRNELRIEPRENVRDGKGTLSFLHLVEGKGAVQKNTNLLSEITLPPGTSIGYHAHTGETEFYIVLEGSGKVSDNGTEKSVSKGDVMITGNGDAHSVENTGSVPLVLCAIIVNG
jgi:mannose-6-phosphate isomerase-like protein (cupin superfamily)